MKLINNSTYTKLVFHRLIEFFCVISGSVLADSLLLRNPLRYDVKNHFRQATIKTLFLSIFFLSNICCTNSQNTIIWEVTDTVNHKKSYILGTFHNIGNSFIDSIPIIKTALLNSDIAIFESIDEEGKLIDVLQKRKRQNDLQKFLSKQDYLALKKLSRSWKTRLDILKPIEVMLTLSREFQITKCRTVKPTDKWTHFDNYLIDIAKQHNISILGVETDSIQLNILDDMEKSWGKEPICQEISSLIAKLTNEQSWYEECQETEQYQRFEIDYEFENDCIDDILVIKRNEFWMTKLTNLLAEKNCFVAVGLLHLKNDCGLLESFKRLGFIVRPLEITKTKHQD